MTSAAYCEIWGKTNHPCDRPTCEICVKALRDDPRFNGKGGLRHNSGKLPLHLISPYATEGEAAVLEHGRVKYAARNWEKGLSWSETMASLKRHILEWEKGNDLDDGPGGSGLPHVDHVQVNAMFLSHFFHTKTGTDDRPLPRAPVVGKPVGVVVLLRLGDQFWFAKRLRSDRPYYGMMAAPGGTVEEWEHHGLAAQREVEEETGLHIGAHRFKYGSQTGHAYDDGRPFSMHWYVVDLTPVEVPRQTEPEKQGAWQLLRPEEANLLTPGTQAAIDGFKARKL